MSHFIKVCSCGQVITQCRCMSKDKTRIVVENGCAACKKNLERIITEPEVTRQMRESQWQYLKRLSDEARAEDEYLP
jgi:hypothetical protein